MYFPAWCSKHLIAHVVFTGSCHHWKVSRFSMRSHPTIVWFSVLVVSDPNFDSASSGVGEKRFQRWPSMHEERSALKDPLWLVDSLSQIALSYFATETCCFLRLTGLNSNSILQIFKQIGLILKRYHADWNSKTLANYFFYASLLLMPNIFFSALSKVNISQRSFAIIPKPLTNHNLWTLHPVSICQRYISRIAEFEKVIFCMSCNLRNIQLSYFFLGLWAPFAGFQTTTSASGRISCWPVVLCVFSCLTLSMVVLLLVESLLLLLFELKFLFVVVLRFAFLLLSVEATPLVLQLLLRSKFVDFSRLLLSEWCLPLIKWGRRMTVYFGIWEFSLARQFLSVSLFLLSDDDFSCCSKMSSLKSWPRWFPLKKSLRFFSDFAALRQLAWPPSVSWSGWMRGFAWLCMFSKRLNISLSEGRRRHRKKASHVMAIKRI